VAKILVVEDDPIIRQTVEYSLKRAGFNVASSGDGLEALDLARALNPDLILLDLMLPGIDGYEFAEKLRLTDTEVAIIMVTALDQERANLGRVKERAVLDQSKTIEVGDLVIEPSELRVSVAGVPAKLRLKEFQLLVALATHQGALRTRQHLAQEVWGYDFLPSSRTIDVHIRRLRQAVEDPSAFVYIHTVHGMGYRFDPQPRSGTFD